MLESVPDQLEMLKTIENLKNEVMLHASYVFRNILYSIILRVLQVICVNIKNKRRKCSIR